MMNSHVLLLVNRAAFEYSLDLHCAEDSEQAALNPYPTLGDLLGK
jgi:hypothetical protein